MSKRKSNTTILNDLQQEEKAETFPPRRSSRNSDPGPGRPSSSTSMSSNDESNVKKSKSKAGDGNHAYGSQHASHSHPVLDASNARTFLTFNEDGAFSAQIETSMLFDIPRHLIGCILYTGYFDTMFIIRKLRITCRYIDLFF